MKQTWSRPGLGLLAALAWAWLASSPGWADETIRYLDQGAAWTPAARAQFYGQDQGSQLIPLAWLKALKQPDGTRFMDGALARYGYLPNPDPMNPDGLPVGFTHADSPQGTMVGMTCSACHTRQIHVGEAVYRIDGGPAIADFQTFLVDLDAAVRRALASDATFVSFAGDVGASDTGKLRADVEVWWTRFHALVSRAVPTDKPWGPARLDAITMIYDRLDGLDLGPPPTFLIPENIARADAPARYPFLWNATRQDFTQWGGFSENGNDMLGVSRSLGEVYGVFGAFHPQPASPTSPLDRSYLAGNSTNFAGLASIEGLLHRLGPPKWPWPVDAKLAAEGKAIFNRPIAAGGCVACHGIARGLPRSPNLDTWRTPTYDVGTDVHQWQIITLSAQPGVLTGASIPGTIPPLQAKDLALDVLKLAVVGTIVDYQTAASHASGTPSAMPTTPISSSQMDGSYKLKDMPPPAAVAPTAPKPVYESRVLQGIWAAAPYLHNGSVPTLVELLKPAAERVKAFKIGPAYDIAQVGLAVDQTAFDFTLHTTGCEDRTSGDSNCGHEYGTRLSDADKTALLEYLKTL